MKPIKLIISAFGPYAGRMPEINFQPFEQKGLFLVTGETGAGKTMIFDAISFALFGSASGQWRDVNHLRSDQAAEDTETFVDFHFSHQGKDYHIWRRPRYLRKSRRGTGETEEKPKAVLYQGEVPIAEGVTPVDKAVKELLHVDEKQFKQIAMIAQGEFREMLNAKTETRTAILRNIFLTDGYDRLTQKLKHRLDSADERKAKYRNSIIQHFHDIAVPPETEFEEALLCLNRHMEGSSDAWTVEELLELIDRILSHDRMLLKEKEELLREANEKLVQSLEARSVAEQTNQLLSEQKQLKTQQAHLAAKASEMEELSQHLKRQQNASRNVQPADLAWQRKCEEVTQTEQKLKEQLLQVKTAAENAAAAEIKWNYAKQRKAEADELQKTAEKLSDEEKRYHQREELFHLQNRLNAQKEQLELQEVQLLQEEEALEKEISVLRQTVDHLKEVPARLAAAQAEQEQLRSLKARIDTLSEKSLPQRTRARNTLASCQKAFLEARSSYEAAQQQRTTAERILESCRAGILAAALEEGRKCPVCGSLHHPEPAILPSESVSEEQVRQLKLSEEKEQREKEKAFTAAATARTALESLETHLEEEIRRCLADPLLKQPIPHDPDTFSSSVTSAQMLLQKKLSESTQNTLCLQSDHKHLTLAEKKLQTAQDVNRRALLDRRKMLTDENSILEQKISGTKATLEALKDLSYGSLKEAQAAKEYAAQTALTLRNAIETADTEKKAADQAAAAAESARDMLRSNLEVQQAEAEHLLADLTSVLREQGFESVSEMRRFVLPEELLSKKEQQIREYHQSVKTNEALLASVEARSKGLAFLDLENLRQICLGQEETRDALAREVNSISHRITGNNGKRKLIAGQQSPLAAAKKEYTLCARLYRLVRGTTGNGKVTLEQYVQATGFDTILEAANRRLTPMSGGQFLLRRQNGSRSLQSAAFLDLEVVDTWTGRSRPVGNISGGESFKASLSLALGLADTVSSHLGGVQMDALFVDEGFGTLDSKSIDSAMDTLTSLSQKNRLVGIISHREELKSMISHKIIVTKNRNGSSITVDSGD